MCVYIYVDLSSLSLYKYMYVCHLSITVILADVSPNNQIFMSLIQLHILPYNLHILYVHPLVFEIISGLFTPVVIFYIALNCT